MNCLFCSFILPLNEKEIWNHYLTVHSFSRRSTKLYHYIKSLVKPANNNFFYCIECSKEYFNNRAYYAHMFGLHHEMTIQTGAGYDDVTQDIFSDNVKTKRIYKNTLNFRESELNPAECLDYGMSIFEQNLNTKYANNPANNNLTLYIELEVVYKKVQMGQLLQQGLPQKRVTRTVTINREPYFSVLTKFKEELQSSLISTRETASNWVLDRINTMTLSVTDDSLLSSGVILNLIGGKHNAAQFIEMEAVDVDMNEENLEEDISMETEQDLNFIDDDDVEIVNSNANYYRQIENRPEIFLPPDNEVIEAEEEVCEDENQDMGNIHSMNGVVFTKADLQRVNADIDKNMIRSTGTEGYCCYFAILNGLYFKKTGGELNSNEEVFALQFPNLYAVIVKHKASLQFSSVLNCTNIIDEINEELTEDCFNIYQRKRTNYLVDVILSQKNIYNSAISMALKIYGAPTVKGRNMIHLMFEKVDDSMVLDMGVLKDFTVLSKMVVSEKNRRLRKLYTCGKCCRAYVKKGMYETHILGCQGDGEQIFNFNFGVQVKTFEEHIKNVEYYPVSVYYDLETTSSTTDMECISFAYVVISDVKLSIAPSVVYKSVIMNREQLMSIEHFPNTIKSFIEAKDYVNLRICANDVLRNEDNALAQLLTTELHILAAAFQKYLKMKMWNHRFPNLSEKQKIMANYQTKNCCICGFSLNDDLTKLPFSETIAFAVRKYYLDLYNTTDVLEFSEKEFVKIWLECLEISVLKESTQERKEEIQNLKEERALEYSFMAETLLELRDKYNYHYPVSFNFEKEIQNILADEVVVHHCHYSGNIEGIAHKRCNSVIRQETKFKKMNVYAHNAAFDLNYIVKGINYGLLASAETKFPETNALGPDESHIKKLVVGPCSYQDTFQVFGMSLSALCDVKTEKEVNDVEHALLYYLLNHAYFSTVFDDLTKVEKKRVLTLLNNKGYFCYDYITSPELLADKFLPPLPAFHNKLTNTLPDPMRYKEAQEIYTLLKCRNIDDYCCLYNILDSINLAVIFEERTAALQKLHKLNVKNYTSLSVYSAACASLECRSIVQHIPNINVMSAIEDAMHGGFAVVAMRRGFSTKSYEASYITNDKGENVRVMSTIEGQDENNQYGHKQTQKLMRGGFKLFTPAKNGQSKFDLDVKNIIDTYDGEGDLSYMFLVDLYYPEKKHLMSYEEIYPTFFEREKASLSISSPYKLLHGRRPSKIPRPTKKFNKVAHTEKNMGTLFPKIRKWVIIDSLLASLKNGWVLSRVHEYYSVLQDFIMRDYILKNQKIRMEAPNSVVVQLAKNMNNTAFGANAQKIKGRKNIVLMSDRNDALQAANNEIKRSLLCYDEKIDALNLEKSQEMANVNHDVLMQELVMEKYQKKIAALEDKVAEPANMRYHEKTAKSWVNDVENEIYQKLKRGKARSFLRIEKSNSIKYVITEKPPIVTVKNIRFVGAHVLSKAKVSIINFAQSIYDVFDIEKNPLLQAELDMMEIERVWPALLFSDTDSVYFNFLAVYKVMNPKISEEFYQQWIREMILVHNYKRIDTSNLLHNPFREIKNKKKLDMFQFETDTPCLKQIIANNPKEYIKLFDDGEYFAKHKGIPARVKVEFQSYLRRVQPFSTVFNELDLISSEKVTYMTLKYQKKKTFLFNNMKTNLAQLSDKVYILKDGVQTLQHGHVLLKEIYAASKGKTSEQIQTDKHLQLLCGLEEEIYKKHPRLAIYNKFISENIGKFNVC